MIVRAATPSDIPAIARIHVDTWRTTYQGIMPDELLDNLSYEKREHSWQQINQQASENCTLIYVAEDDLRRIVGFANGGVERTGDPVYQGELYAIYILQNHQNKGIGRELVRVVAEHLSQRGIQSMLAWVLADNPACRFYESLGGQRVYEREIERGSTKLLEIAYGWKDTSYLRQTCPT
jgi:ribosomal protein S18 acetylase RimI-like enzyme